MRWCIVTPFFSQKVIWKVLSNYFLKVKDQYKRKIDYTRSDIYINVVCGISVQSQPYLKYCFFNGLSSTYLFPMFQKLGNYVIQNGNLELIFWSTLILANTSKYKTVEKG